MKRITPGQIKAIHAQARKAGIGEDNYRAAVREVSNGLTDTSTELSYAEAEALIVKLGGTAQTTSRRTQQRRNKAAGVTKLASPKQLGLLKQLWVLRVGAEQATEALRKFCQGQIKKDGPLTSPEAIRLIQATRAMNKREGK